MLFVSNDRGKGTVADTFIVIVGIPVTFSASLLSKTAHQIIDN